MRMHAWSNFHRHPGRDPGTARHLLEAKTSLKEIAARTGYASQGQFSKAFIRRLGGSPGLFSEMHSVG